MLYIVYEIAHSKHSYVPCLCAMGEKFTLDNRQFGKITFHLSRNENKHELLTYFPCGRLVGVFFYCFSRCISFTYTVDFLREFCHGETITTITDGLTFIPAVRRMSRSIGKRLRSQSFVMDSKDTTNASGGFFACYCAASFVTI